MFKKKEPSKVEQDRKELNKLQKKITDNEEFIAPYSPDIERRGAKALNQRAALVETDLLAGKVAKESDWEKKVDKYNRLKNHLEMLEQTFNKYSKDIIRNGPNEENEIEFEMATLKYINALKKTNEALQFMANGLTKDLGNEDKFPSRYQQLNSFHESLDEKRKKCKEVTEAVGQSISERQLKAPQTEGQKVNLKNAISIIDQQYKQAYDTAYGKTGFWRWVHNLFTNSDRAKEISFLKQISEHNGCNELIRAQAISLVQHKIREKEWFGSTSKLGNMLGNLLTGVVSDKRGEHKNLVRFINDNQDLKKAMPTSLKSYFEEKKEELDNQIINTIR